MLCLLAVVVVACIAVVAYGEPERWETRGFGSEAECWQNHGWDGSINNGANRKSEFDFWCG